MPGLAIGIDSLSSIDTSATEVRLSLAGAQPVLVFRSANVPAVTKVGDAVTPGICLVRFTTLKTTAESYQSDLKTKVDEMIAQRIAADDVLTAAVSAQASSDELPALQFKPTSTKTKLMLTPQSQPKKLVSMH